MDDAYKKYVKILHNNFEESFMNAYRDASVKKRRKALPYLQAIHRRWYYATLVEHTPFSPANLMGCIGKYFNVAPDTYPVATLKTPSKVTGIDYHVLSYTSQKHPAVQDLRTVIDFCTPHIDLHEAGSFHDEQALEVAELLSITDPHYASFMLEISLVMKLLSKMPSLYVQRMQPSKKSGEILARADSEVLMDIIDAAISVAASGMRMSIPMPEAIFTDAFVRSLLTTPMETDDIFARVFNILGYDIEDLLDIGSMPISDEMSPEHLGLDMELLSGTFVMGIVLDRFFFTPFGHFLRIIRPMYALPFAFTEEVVDYVNVADDPEEAFVAFFAPCSSYTLTELGLEVLKTTPTENNYFDAGELKFENMKDTIFIDDYTFATFVEMARQLSSFALSNGMPAAVYTFRVRLESDNSMWLHLQVPDNFSLAELYDEIAQHFDLKNNGDFSFFHDKIENRFAEYPSTKRAAKSKNPKPQAEECILSDLDFEHMSQLILAAYNQTFLDANSPPTVRFHLERLNEKPPDFSEEYPMVSRVSKNMRLQEDAEDEIF